jgi:hypothetical protein
MRDKPSPSFCRPNLSCRLTQIRALTSLAKTVALATPTAVRLPVNVRLALKGRCAKRIMTIARRMRAKTGELASMGSGSIPVRVQRVSLENAAKSIRICA